LELPDTFVFNVCVSKPVLPAFLRDDSPTLRALGNIKVDVPSIERLKKLARQHTDPTLPL